MGFSDNSRKPKTNSESQTNFTQNSGVVQNNVEVKPDVPIETSEDKAWDAFEEQTNMPSSVQTNGEPYKGVGNTASNVQDAWGQSTSSVATADDGAKIKTVDPSKSKKVQKRKEAKSSKRSAQHSESNGKKKLPKWAPIALIAVVVIAMIIAKKIGGIGGKDNYITVVDGILNNDVGTFKYVFDVRTTEHGSSETQTTTSADISELENAESVEGAENAEGDNDSISEKIIANSSTFVAWTNSEGIEVTSWRYPKYQLTLEGIVTSVEPYTADIKVSLATEHHNDLLTEFIAIDNNYYIDIEQLRSWLVHSGDSYLQYLGSELPEGSKWLVVPFDKFSVPSRYAEDSELELSSAKSFYEITNRIKLFKNTFESQLTSDLSKKALSSGDSVYYISISGDDANKIVSKMKGVSQNVGSVYRSYVDNAASQGLYDETQQTQARRQEDNIIKALTDFMVYMTTADLSTTNLVASGEARKYSNSAGNTTLEANLVTNFQTKDKDYYIKADLMRSGDKSDVVVPEGSTLTTDRLPYDTLILDTCNGIADYLNPTSIKLENKLELNPKRIEESIKQSLITLVNATPAAETYLTMLTVDDYIAKYANFDTESSAITADLVNAKIVSDFMETVNAVTGGVIIEVEVQPIEEEAPKYPDLLYEDANIKINASVNQSLSDVNMIALDMFVMNKSDGTVTLNLTDFSLKTLLSSIYPANNITLLRNYDNNWDESLSPEELTMESNTYSDITLYFVVSSDGGYMDLWYGGTKLGEVVAY